MTVTRLSPGVVVYGGIELVEPVSQRGGWGLMVEQFAQAGSDQAGVGTGEEQGDGQAVVGDGVPVGAWGAFDQAVQA